MIPAVARIERVALPITVVIIPVHWITEIDSPSRGTANIAVNIGADCVIGTVRETSWVKRTRWERNPLKPKRIPERMAAPVAELDKGTGMPTEAITMMPTNVCERPIKSGRVRLE